MEGKGKGEKQGKSNEGKGQEERGKGGRGGERKWVDNLFFFMSVRIYFTT